MLVWLNYSLCHRFDLASMFRPIARGDARAKFRKTLTKKIINNFDFEGLKILHIGTRIASCGYPIEIEGLFPKAKFGGRKRERETGGKNSHRRIMVVHVFDSETLSYPRWGLSISNWRDAPGPWRMPFFLHQFFSSFFPAFSRMHHWKFLSSVLSDVKGRRYVETCSQVFSR